MPSIFARDLFDNFFEYPFTNYKTDYLMSTDIKDTENGYEITMNMPGVKKEDVKAELKDGYLTIQASTGSNKEEKDNNERYIRQERYVGTSTRSFYVGDGVKQEDIKAKFENGTLKMLVPKQTEQPAVDNKKYIAIEG